MKDRDGAFLGHPAGLGWLAGSEFWERFSYYGMQALLVLYATHYLLLPGHVEHVWGFVPFSRALEASLRDAGLLSGNNQGSKYVLIAHLQKLDQPMFGASMTVTATVQYSLVERATNAEVFARTVSLPYTAAWNAAFSGVERVKLANEGAIRVNIQQLIDALVAAKVSAAGQVRVGG